MPTRAARPCPRPGCPNNHDCADHSRKQQAKEWKRQHDISRADDPFRKLYKTAAWARTRKAVLERDPLCRLARKCTERFGTAIASAVVDHIKPVRDGGDPFDMSNLQGLCKACHDYKTATENGGLGHKTYSTPERSDLMR